MKGKHADNYIRILDIAKSDPEYLRLFQQYQPLNAKMLHLTQQLSSEDISTLMDYIGMKQAIEMRLLELACAHMCFPE